MISTLAIQDALADVLLASALADRVSTHKDPDLDKALEALRDAPSSLLVIVPGADTIVHQLTPGFNFAEQAEISSSFEVLITERDLAMSLSGDPDGITLKDAVIDLLMWHDLGITGLICLPTSCEPMNLQFSNGRGREAWKLTLTLRQLVTQ